MRDDGIQKSEYPQIAFFGSLSIYSMEFQNIIMVLSLYATDSVR